MVPSIHSLLSSMSVTDADSSFDGSSLPFPESLSQFSDDDDDDDFDSMAARVALRRSSSTKLTYTCSCSSIDIDWSFLWAIDDCNAESERRLTQEGESNPRKPTKDYVCFKKWNHPGTVLWRQVVKAIASNTEEYPEWRDDIYESVRIDLHQTYGIRQFLICCDANGKPSKRSNGQWYLATSKEILDRTKQRFADERKALVKEKMTTSGEDVSTSSRSNKRRMSESDESGTTSFYDKKTMDQHDVVETLAQLNNALKTFRSVTESVLSTNPLLRVDLSSTLAENAHWLNHFVESRTRPEKRQKSTWHFNVH